MDREINTEWALRYAAKGWPVFPVGRYKKHLLVDYRREATTEPEQIIEWWEEKYRGANIAIRLGLVSGLLALDLDDGCAPALERMEERHGPLPKTMTQMTGNGGLHLLFQHPGDRPIRSGLGSQAIAPGVALLGDDPGYLFVQPTVFDDGMEYCWKSEGIDTVAPVPPWLLELWQIAYENRAPSI